MNDVISQMGDLIVSLPSSPPFIVQLVLEGLVVRLQPVELGVLLIVSMASAVNFQAPDVAHGRHPRGCPTCLLARPHRLGQVQLMEI